MSEIDDTLKERGEDYGNYSGGNLLRAQILSIITDRYKNVHNRSMEPHYRTMIWDIVNKLSRIAASPNHIDSWHDIQGYAKLIEETLIQEKESNDANKQQS